MYTDIGPLQARVMNHIWDAGSQTVAQVHDALNAQPGAPRLAYTTILTVMRNLTRRGLLKAATEARAHVFTPVTTRDEHRAGAIRNIADMFFGGDIPDLYAFAGTIAWKPASTAAKG